MRSPKRIGTKLYEINKKLGISKVANVVAKAVGKEDCGCKKRAAKIDNLHKGVSNTISNMFQKNKNK